MTFQIILFVIKGIFDPKVQKSLIAYNKIAKNLESIVLIFIFAPKLRSV